MLPPPGRYRLTPTLPAGATPVDVTVTASGVLRIPVPILGGTLMVDFGYSPPPYDMFANAGAAIECTGTGTYQGVCGDVNLAGTCVPIP